ncbi:Tn3 family transposase [Glaciimonas sp. GG7]
MKWQWSEDELHTHWFLSLAERDLFSRKTKHGRLGFAILLKFFQSQGHFPEHRHAIPGTVVCYLSEQIGVTVDSLDRYDWTGRSCKRDRAEVLAFLGIRRHVQKDKYALALWLQTEILPEDPSLEHLGELARDWFSVRHIEPPGSSRLERFLHTTAHDFETGLFLRIATLLTHEAKSSIDALLDIKDDAEIINPAERRGIPWISADPGGVSLDCALQELAKLDRVRQLDLPLDAFAALPAKWLQKYCRRAGAESTWELRRHPDDIRHSLVAAFCWQRQQAITDSLVDLFIQAVHKIGTRAENKVEKQLFEDLRQVRGKTNVLFKLAEAAVGQPEGVIKDVLYPVVGLQTLEDLVKEFKASGKAYKQVVHKVIRASYSNHYRRMLPPIVDALAFQSNNNVHQPVMRALTLLKTYRNSSQQYFSSDEDIPIDGVIRPKWQDIVVEQGDDGKPRINRINYEIGVLQALRERLRNKEIWVVGAHRYRNPDKDLPNDFDANRIAYYDALTLPQDCDTFIAKIKQAMVDGLKTLNQGMPKNPSVKLRDQGKNRIALSPLEAQPDPENLKYMKAEIFRRWASTSLLDMLKETDLRIDFTKVFQSSRQRETLDRDTLQRRLLLCLYALGTNAGIKRVAAGGHGASYQELLYVRHSFLQKNTLREAISQIANATFAVRLPEIWGEGTTSCASDSKKFGAWDQNLLTEWHVRYGGRGVMIYWHVENKSVCIYSQLKRCSSSEVASMIEGVLRHETDANVQKQYTDSHGQSEVGFAFCYLLGFDLLPRLKAIASQKLYLPEVGSASEYTNLASILTNPIKWELIRQQYDEMVKYATALRLGTADAEAILRRFARGNLQHPTYKALAELGKAIKTIFMCRYLHSEALRREIHEGLNVVENWNSANGFIFYGQSGEIASNRMEDQELSVLSLHLLQLCLVYVNTLMIQQVLAEGQWKKRMNSVDLRALSPLIYAHVNPYGRFELDMNVRLPIHSEAGLLAA